ncbi:U-box domain-containing protein 6-like isoform X1 [Ananas comosus]|uniref:U-box domain-containing protein 6 n=1 Tax=Ananas comosus TaxID=4615 RepID=A0A199UH75_ANACO|nr:U-box domain-containing protein 6-like isoform X1 [Ananas comosus]XP_020089608.1 U-box domain-containing protein 6-like isoform X1 [Ananas comosus]XP_020089609.1 U-box domain-containing protein 6-like isoform X1 [Ananas comosus]OAY64093.1 U-box domain-containing protein 6 [Ananas comosus]
MESGLDEMELINSCGAKVHDSICLELAKLLDKAALIIPTIESARPGGRLGIQELCSLNNTVEKGKLILQHCTECSKLYLAITGESILSRCERIRNSLNQSLCQIQNLVPPLVGAKITEVLDYLRDAKFIINSTEEEAGKALLELLRQTDSGEEHEFATFQIVASKLSLTSPRDISIERRSTKNLLDKFRGADPQKEKILKYFLYLLKKYGNNISSESSNCETKQFGARID